MSHSIYSAGHFSTTIGRLLYWLAMGSLRWSVRLSPVTPCPQLLLQLVQYSSSMWQWSRACMVSFWIQSCGMRCCEVWPCVVSIAVFVCSKNDRLQRTLLVHQVVVSDWQNWCRNLSDVNICFQRGSSEADCSIWLFCRVQKWNESVKDAEYSGCLPTGRMYRNVGHIYGIWHEDRYITVHKLANDLGSLLVYAINFDTIWNLWKIV